MNEYVCIDCFSDHVVHGDTMKCFNCGGTVVLKSTVRSMIHTDFKLMLEMAYLYQSLYVDLITSGQYANMSDSARQKYCTISNKAINLIKNIGTL